MSILHRATGKIPWHVLKLHRLSIHPRAVPSLASLMGCKHTTVFRAPCICAQRHTQPHYKSYWTGHPEQDVLINRYLLQLSVQVIIILVLIHGIGLGFCCLFLVLVSVSVVVIVSILACCLGSGLLLQSRLFVRHCGKQSPHLCYRPCTEAVLLHADCQS